MAVQVALQREVGQRLTLRDRQQLLQRRVRVDVVLVTQVLLLDVVIHAPSNLAAAHQSTSGLAQELAQLIRDLHRALEDAGLAGLRLATLRGRSAAALALAGILDLTVHTLLQALNLAQQSRDSLLQSVQVARDNLDVLIQSGGGARSRSGRGLHRGARNHDGCRGGRRRGSRSLLGSRLLRGSRLDGGGRRRNSGRRDGRGSLLLRNLLGGGLGGGGGRAHYTRGGGSRRGHFTRYANRTVIPGCQFWIERARFFQIQPGCSFFTIEKLANIVENRPLR